MPVTLDSIDLKILRELQADGRLTNVALAQRVGLSAPPCLRRVRALEAAGLITGYHAEVDAARLGFAVTAFVMVALHSQAEADLRAFENRVLGWPLVRECHMLSGEMDYMLRVAAPDLPRFQSFVIQDLSAAPNVAGMKSFVTIRQAKSAPGVPIGGGA